MVVSVESADVVCLVTRGLMPNVFSHLIVALGFIVVIRLLKLLDLLINVVNNEFSLVLEFLGFCT